MVKSSWEKSQSDTFTVIFDQHCFPCRSLAAFMEQKEPTIIFLSREKFLAQKPEDLILPAQEVAQDELWVLTAERWMFLSQLAI